jgi:ribosomal protein L16 Arg81 hydroxylase
MSMSDGSGDELAQFLSPITPQEFLSEYWEKKPLYVRGTPLKFARLFDRQRFDRAILNVGFDKRKPAPFSIRALWRNRHDLQAGIEIGPTQVREALASRTTVCVNDITAGDPVLAEFAAHIKRQMHLATPVRFNCYLSPDGEGLDTHYDARHATIVQISGSKRWLYSRLPATAYPLANALVEKDGRVRHGEHNNRRQKLDVPTPDESQFAEVLLEPGDLLYLPPGTWHNAKASGESLALNMAFETVGMLPLLFPELERVLSEKLDWRAILPAAALEQTRPGELPLAVEQFMVARLGELRDMIGRLASNGVELERMWRRAVTSSPYVSLPGQAPTSPLKPDDVLVRTEPYPLSYVRRPGPDGTLAVYVYGCNAEVALSGDALALVKALTTRQRFTVAEVEQWGDISWKQGIEVLEVLLTRGLLRREGEQLAVPVVGPKPAEHV